MATAPHETIRYICAACKTSTTLTVQDWRALPRRTLASLEAYGIEDVVLRDFAGIGIDAEKVRQLESAGLDFVELHRQPRRQRPDA